MPSNIYFTKVLALPHGEAFLLGHMAAEGHAPTFTRLMLVSATGWKLVGDLHDVAYAVARGPARPGARPDVAVVGRNGLFHIYSAGQPPTVGRIPSDQVTYLQAAAYVGGTLHVCGGQRQVYRWHNAQWQSLAAEIHQPFEGRLTSSFNAITSNGGEEVLCVGDGGDIQVLSNGHWRCVASPTKADLLCAIWFDQRYLIGGVDGTLLEFDGAHTVSVVKHPSFAGKRINDLCGYRDECDIAASDRLIRMAGRSFAVVDTSHDAHTNAIVSIDASADALWMTGGADVIRFDGNRWSIWVCPDNA